MGLTLILKPSNTWTKLLDSLCAIPWYLPKTSDWWKIFDCRIIKSCIILLNPKPGPVHTAPPLSIQANSEYLILKWTSRVGVSIIISQKYSTLSTLLHCTQVSHLLLSRHKKCSYLAPIRDIDPKFFGLCRYDPNLKLELV